MSIAARAAPLGVVALAAHMVATQRLRGGEAARSSRLSVVGDRQRDSSLRDQNVREGCASEALLFDDLELEVLLEVCEWAAAGADRNRDRRQLVLVDEAQAGHRLGEGPATMDQDRPFVVPGLAVRNVWVQVPAVSIG